jgi:large subunit ribosomal protein L29
MKANELRQKSLTELTALRMDLVRESFNLHIQRATGQLSKPDQIRKVRKDIARVNTIVTEKGVGS